MKKTNRIYVGITLIGFLITLLRIIGLDCWTL